ncbi:hypothetical protein PYCC9005_004216 [Savitreella phatthalungensis]
MDKFGPIGFAGQRLAAQISTWGLATSAIVAFIVGFCAADAWLSVWVFLAASALVAAIVVPPWPFYEHTKHAWQPSAYKLAVERLQQELEDEQARASSK